MNELEEIEIQLLLEGIYRYYGFDFRNYAVASLKRRIFQVVQAEKLHTVAGLLEQVLHDPACMERFLLGVTMNPTAMFREPEFYVAFRAQIVPLLRTYPFVRIWHVGCSTGEEVYSMAILLHEAGLYHRCRIYATDMNELVLHQAKAGIFSLDLMKEYDQLYLKAGGQQLFSDYYSTRHGNAILQPFLKENLVFSTHNLVTDASFNEFNVIFCHNVLIYFNQWLQDRVHKLLYDSLRVFGILSLGKQETLLKTPHEQDYEVLDAQTKLYRRMI